MIRWQLITTCAASATVAFLVSLCVLTWRVDSVREMAARYCNNHPVGSICYASVIVTRDAFVPVAKP